MFGIKSDVITLRSIEMYGFVTVWTSMDDGPYWVILLMYVTHPHPLPAASVPATPQRSPAVISND